MKLCPHCSSRVHNSARTCRMCGNGLPAKLRSADSRLPVLLAFLVVIGLFVGAFFLGKWQADSAAITASLPPAAPAAVTPTRGRPTVGEPASGDVPAATPKVRP